MQRQYFQNTKIDDIIVSIQTIKESGNIVSGNFISERIKELTCLPSALANSNQANQTWHMLTELVSEQTTSLVQELYRSYMANRLYYMRYQKSAEDYEAEGNREKARRYSEKANYYFQNTRTLIDVISCLICC